MAGNVLPRAHRKNLALEPCRYTERKRAAHHRGSLRLEQLCRSNGGLYIKAGQHLATLRCTQQRPAVWACRSAAGAGGQARACCWRRRRRQVRPTAGVCRAALVAVRPSADRPNARDRAGRPRTVQYARYVLCGKRASVDTRVRSRVRACIHAYPHHCIDRSLSAAGRRAGTGCAGSSSNSREHGR